MQPGMIHHIITYNYALRRLTFSRNQISPIWKDMRSEQRASKWFKHWYKLRFVEAHPDDHSHPEIAHFKDILYREKSFLWLYNMPRLSKHPIRNEKNKLIGSMECFFGHWFLQHLPPFQPPFIPGNGPRDKDVWSAKEWGDVFIREGIDSWICWFLWFLLVFDVWP